MAIYWTRANANCSQYGLCQLILLTTLKRYISPIIQMRKLVIHT